MALLETTSSRTANDNYVLGGSTALVAGLVNVCGVMAFFAFASNVTGHVAVFAEELVKGHHHQLLVVSGWLGLFLGGATAGSLAVWLGNKRPTLRLVPLAVEALLLTSVAYYGSMHYAETLRETEQLVGVLLFAMGMQNGLVASASGGSVKTTHLTGLMTDLGVEIAAGLVGRLDAGLRVKLRLHLIIFLAYVGGGVAGGLMFQRLGFHTLYIGGAMLGALVLSEVSQKTRGEGASHLPPVLASLRLRTGARDGGE